MGLTLFEKIWNRHVVAQLPDDWALLHIDRHLLHDLSGAIALNEVKSRGFRVRNPELVFATADHAVATVPGRTGATNPDGAVRYAQLKAATAEAGIRFFDLGKPGQGIVHVMAPELGLVQPGMTLICGDSHTCTNGALGALAFGIGSSEITHALATQTLLQRKPRTMNIQIRGELGGGVFAKDIGLFLIGLLGTRAGTGYAVEYSGPVVSALSVESRMTLCNLSIELGAKIGMIAPDNKTFAYLQGKPFSPAASRWSEALAQWQQEVGDADAVFDAIHVVDVDSIGPMMTWGTSPEQVIEINQQIPSLDEFDPGDARDDVEAALRYMALRPGATLLGTPVDRVFIGACTNARLTDLREAARLVDGKRVAANVRAWVVPGSEQVKRDAEHEGLDDIFRSAGFEWREPGCSMCVAANGERAKPGERVVSTSNRNFVGRQGPGVRTHLASPASAAAAALAGKIVDPREVI
ncbi:3-isopropylmalate dehydratase large subunit [Paraburkholderia silvatlantica]|uniref:3-isopropylmalate dehydratase n=1 Tax=Paraburkholderia silvatlantica TaxID=321895 RepID=A0ABR6FX08_9BURK|nr:3-isopropylmalate dehydratase large subunit [Paraburkholderia silvatlantica]MBB2931968.1 3-isopropylmalate/(R)-2-methylmalate dehydratase large subunit [Paraburkholderia silvatlantica]PVY24645.1 3-isopropylmalate dehydratase large subunit [Paraburkholderia silvatlantica]PXW31141.1 3-isopropylmalate dehydratase large subunit [Paraburkholderia silvatlantica]